jgi:hypothetical protein
MEGDAGIGLSLNPKTEVIAKVEKYFSTLLLITNGT